MTCQHFYVLGPPVGQFSKGVCRLCEDVRYFPNHLPVPGEKILSGIQVVRALSYQAGSPEAKARAQKAQAARGRTDKTCPVCELPYQAYTPTQVTCGMPECKRAWKAQGTRQRRAKRGLGRQP